MYISAHKCFLIDIKQEIEIDTCTLWCPKGTNTYLKISNYPFSSCPSDNRSRTARRTWRQRRSARRIRNASGWVCRTGNVHFFIILCWLKMNDLNKKTWLTFIHSPLKQSWWSSIQNDILIRYAIDFWMPTNGVSEIVIMSEYKDEDRLDLTKKSSHYFFCHC